MSPRREAGVALAVVIWFIAGMSLLVAGIVSQARVDTQMAQLHIARAKAAAAGDGAIQLAMRGNGQRPAGGNFRIGEDPVLVTLYRAERLIDMNRADAAVLAQLFAMAGGLDRAEAKSVADNVVKWRTQTRGRRDGGRFETQETLLQVDGVTRTLLDSVRDYIVANPRVRGIENLQEAAAVLRGQGQKQNREQGAADVYRADALFTYGGRTWLRRSWVTTRTSRWTSLPWRVMHVEPARVVAVKN